MPAISLATAQAQLTLWIEADTAVASGQSYTIGSRSLTRASAAEITEKIKFWQSKCASLARGGGVRIRRVLPRDGV